MFFMVTDWPKRHGIYTCIKTPLIVFQVFYKQPPPHKKALDPAE